MASKSFFYPASWFGLDYADTVIERVPLILGNQRRQHITRIAPKKFEEYQKETSS